MSDPTSEFERRLGRALDDGAASAPGVVGLAGGARTRARRRRHRRVSVMAAAAVLAVVIPLGVVATRSDDAGNRPAVSSPHVTAGPTTDTDALAAQRVTCGDGASWAVATMDGGLPDAVDDAEVRAAFADVLAEAPMDAPRAIIDDGPERASYIVLAADGDSYTLGVGPWSTAGPGTGADYALLQRRADGSLDVQSWGGCRLTVALPEDRSQVVVTAPDGGVDPGVTDPTVVVNEEQCTGSRDPLPYLGDPVVVEDDDRVVVTLTSETMQGTAFCAGNPSVPLTLHLDAPLGDRELLDGGTYPPTPIQVGLHGSPDDGWHTVSHESISVEVPDGWRLLDTSSCPGEVRIGPLDADPCSWPSTLSFYYAAAYDSLAPPGLPGADDGYGHVVVGDRVLAVDGPDHETTRRILASATGPGETPQPVDAWRTIEKRGVLIDVPERAAVDLRVSVGIIDGIEGWVGADRRPDGRWRGSKLLGDTHLVYPTAETEALAQVIASTARFD